MFRRERVINGKRIVKGSRQTETENSARKLKKEVAGFPCPECGQFNAKSKTGLMAHMRHCGKQD